MAATLNTVARANIRSSKKKYILTGIGIAISSFFISAVLMLTASLQATMDATVGDVYANSENMVVSAGVMDQDNQNSTAKFPMSNDTVKKIQESPEVSSSWILYTFSGTYGADKEKVAYGSAPPSKDLSPFGIEGNLPSTDTELLVAKSFAEKHNLKIGDKVTMPNIVASATDKDNAKDTEYTLTATFNTGISDSQMSDNVFIGGTGLADTARQLAEEEGGIVSDPAKPMAPQAFIKLKNNTQDSRDALQKKLNTGDKNTTPKVLSNALQLAEYHSYRLRNSGSVGFFVRHFEHLRGAGGAACTRTRPAAYSRCPRWFAGTDAPHRITDNWGLLLGHRFRTGIRGRWHSKRDVQLVHRQFLPHGVYCRRTHVHRCDRTRFTYTGAHRTEYFPY